MENTGHRTHFGFGINILLFLLFVSLLLASTASMWMKRILGHILRSVLSRHSLELARNLSFPFWGFFPKLSVIPTTVSLTQSKNIKDAVTIDPVDGNDANWPTGTIKSFAPLCGHSSLASPDVTIINRPNAATVPARCNITAVRSITCFATPCFVDFGFTGQFVVSGRESTPTLPISDITIVADSHNALPLFLITGNVTIKMDRVEAQFWIRRPLVYAGPGSTFQMHDSSVLTFENTPETADNIMTAENATIAIENCNFANSVIHNASIFSISASSYLLINQTDWNNTIFREAGSIPTHFIHSVDSSIVIDTLTMRYTSVYAHASTLHPSIISFRRGFLSTSYTNVLYTSFITSSSRYASVISMSNAVYSLFHSEMKFSASPGCNYVFASGSMGSIEASFFWNGNITGTPSENVANGTKYPPFEIPTVASVICLVKGLDNLRNDFGWPRRNPLSPLNRHRLQADFTQNSFISSDPSMNRKVMNSANIHVLYGTDIWASNVRLEFTGYHSRDTSTVSVPSIRTEGCIVVFGGPTFQSCGWIDFGSHSFHPAGVTTMIHRTLGIYGAAPGNVSIIESAAALQTDIYIPGNTPSIITGGIFKNVNLRLTNGVLTIGSVYSESILLSPPEPINFVDILEIQNNLYVTTGEVVLARTVGPFKVGVLDITGSLKAPRLASPLAISPNPAEIIGDIILRGTLDVTDLKVTGFFLADSSASTPTINVRISTSKNIFHGLDIIGNFNTPRPDIFVPNLQLLLDPAYGPPANLSINQEHPIPYLRLTGAPIGYTPNFSFFPDGHTFLAPDYTLDTQNRKVYSFHWVGINARTYYHPTGAGLVIAVPPNFIDMVAGQGYSQNTSCYGLIASPSFVCKPLSTTTILAVSKDGSSLTLTPATAATFLSNGPAPAYPADVEPSVLPTIYIKAIETEFIRDPTFMLDTYYSTCTGAHLTGPDTFGIMWSYESTHPSSNLDTWLPTLPPNSWQLEIQSSHLDYDVDYTFRATIQRARWLARPTAQGEITVRRSSKPKSLFCQAPSLSIDAPTDTSIYPDTRPLFRTVYDTSCPPPMAKVNIVWTLKGPGVLVMESSVGSTYTLPILPKNLSYGTKLTLNATANYDGFSNYASSQIQLTYKPYEPNVYYGGEFDRDAILGMVDITPTVQPVMGAISRSYGTRLCPITAFEASQDIYADLNPFGTQDVVCRFNDSSKAAYKMAIEYRDARLVVSPTSEWGAGDHRFDISTAINVFDEYKFSIPLSVVIRKSQDGYTPKVVIQLYNDTMARQYPYQLRQSSDSIALVALLSNGSICIGCHYDWKVLEPVDYVTDPTNSSVFFLPSVGRIAPGANIAVSVKVSYYKGPSYTTIEGRIQLRNGFYPFGGRSFSVVSSNLYSFITYGQESLYAPLQFMHLGACEEQYRIVRYFGTSVATPQFFPPRHRCSSSYRFLSLVVDRLGTSVIVEMNPLPIFPTAPMSWSESLLLEYASNFSKSVEAHNIDSVVRYLNDLSGLADADPNDWNNTKSQVAPMIISSLGKLIDVPYVDLIVCNQFSNSSLWTLLGSNELTGVVLKTCLKAPSPGLSAFSTIRFQSALAVIAGLQAQYFNARLMGQDRRIQASNWFDSIPNTRQLWSLVRDIIKPGLTTSPAVYTQSVPVIGQMLDIQSVQPGEISCGGFGAASFSLNSDLVQAMKPVNSVLTSVVSMYFARFTHPLIPTDRFLAPFGTATVTYIENLNPDVDGYLKVNFAFSTLDPLTCVSFQGESGSWLPNCNTVQDGLGFTCTCPVSGKLAGQVSVSLLNLQYYCASLPPQGGSFLCENGTWVSVGSIDVPIIVIEEKTPVVTIVGNLTTDVIVFNGLQSSINVTGCTKIGTSITISLSIEEFEALILSGQTSDLLITSSGCDISGLASVPITAVVPEGRCEKITTTSQSTSSSLSAVFTIDRSGCKKGSKTWWIVLVSVFGGIIVLAAVFAILATVTPLKHYIRPFTRRAEQAANTYYVEK